MIDLAGLLVIGGATMLGLKLLRTFDSFLSLGIKPTIKKAAPAKPPSPLTTSSPSATSSAPSKLLPWEPLDACIQKDGAMDPFHSFFDHTLFGVGLANPQKQDITTSIESHQVPAVSQGTTSYLSLHESGHPLEVTPFSDLFPQHLLLKPVESVIQANSNDLPSLAMSPPCNLSLHPDQLLHDQVISSDLTSIDADLAGGPNEHALSQDDSGRTSPQSHAGTDEDFGSLLGTLSSSRRSSWATSISPTRADIGDDSCSLGSEKSAADLDQDVDITELLDDYEHYSDLIDVGNPDNVRKRDFIAPAPGAEGGMDAATVDEDAQIYDEPTIEAHGDTATACEESPAMDVATDLSEEPDMEMATGETDADMPAADEPTAEASGYTVLECPYDLTSEAGTELEPDEPPPPPITSSAELEPPHTPAEEVAWAHSHCDDSPENTRIRILSDEQGREYVLYFNCFHVLPLEMAREFMPRDNDDDDLDVPQQLGTIPEEEDEG